MENAGPPSMEREMDKYKCTMYIRKHFSQAKKLLINITECKVLNYTTDKNITADRQIN